MDAVKLDLTGEAQNPDRERVTMFQQFAIGYKWAAVVGIERRITAIQFEL